MTGLEPTRKATDWSERSCGWAQASRGGFATVFHSCVVEGIEETLPQLASKGGAVLTGTNFEKPI